MSGKQRKIGSNLFKTNSKKEYKLYNALMNKCLKFTGFIYLLYK